MEEFWILLKAPSLTRQMKWTQVNPEESTNTDSYQPNNLNNIDMKTNKQNIFRYSHIGRNIFRMSLQFFFLLNVWIVYKDQMVSNSLFKKGGRDNAGVTATDTDSWINGYLELLQVDCLSNKPWKYNPYRFNKKEPKTHQNNFFKKTILIVKFISLYGKFQFLCAFQHPWSTSLVLKQRKILLGKEMFSSLKILFLDSCCTC